MKKSVTKNKAVQVSVNMQMWFVAAAAVTLVLALLYPLIMIFSAGHYNVGFGTLTFSVLVALFPFTLFLSAYWFGPAYKTILARMFYATLSATIGVLIYAAVSMVLRHIITMAQTSQSELSFWNSMNAEYLYMGIAWVVFTYVVYKKWYA